MTRSEALLLLKRGAPGIEEWNHTLAVQGVAAIPDLAGADLRGASLRGANLLKAKLEEANLRGAKFEEGGSA